MSEIIEVDDLGNSDQIVVMGDERATQRISFQLAQDFYNEITGKSEKLKDYGNEPFILKISDVEQLHHRIIQCTEAI